jgi:hypothetical protein
MSQVDTLRGFEELKEDVARLVEEMLPKLKVVDNVQLVSKGYL